MAQVFDQAAPTGTDRAAASLLADPLAREDSNGDWSSERARQRQSYKKALFAYVHDRFGAQSTVTASAIRNAIAIDIARIDKLLANQVNCILHHTIFQRVEASWRGAEYLVEQAGDDDKIRIKVLNCGWSELARDVAAASMPDETHLFQAVYDDAIGRAGEDPFTCLIGDYYIQNLPSPGHPEDDIATLRCLSGVAAASFAPLITGAHPSLLGLSAFSKMELPLIVEATFRELEYTKWRSFRETEDSRFIGLTLPRVLMRAPYRDDCNEPHGFRFHEDVEAADSSKYLWGNSAFAFGGVLIRTFSRTRWFVDIRGFNRNETGDGGGIVNGLPQVSFRTDSPSVAVKAPVEVMIGEINEGTLSECGLIPLCFSSSNSCVFYANQSAQKPRSFQKSIATANAKLSGMLQYILCVSRIAHYVKIIGRNLCGSTLVSDQIESVFRDWLTEHVAADDAASAHTRASHPLRDCSVSVSTVPGKPGAYFCEMHLLPHSQMDLMTAGIRLVTQLNST